VASALEGTDGACGIKVAWVEGHTTRLDVELGRISAQDRQGNLGADQLAGEGALMHIVDMSVHDEVKLQIDGAFIVQAMMLAVVQARFLHREIGALPNK